MRNTLRTAVLAAAVIGALAMSTASASTGSPKTASFLVSITIENSCTVTAQPIAFGLVSTMAPVHDAQGNVVVTCTGAGPIDLQLNVGTGGGTLATRQMDDGLGNKVDYNLYNDAGHTVISGDGTTGQTLNAGATTSTGAAQTFTVYGETVAGQDPKPVGTYNSTVTATLTY
jgi:spore coat protein U-like protein